MWMIQDCVGVQQGIFLLEAEKTTFFHGADHDADYVYSRKSLFMSCCPASPSISNTSPPTYLK